MITLTDAQIKSIKNNGVTNISPEQENELIKAGAQIIIDRCKNEKKTLKQIIDGSQNITFDIPYSTHYSKSISINKILAFDFQARMDSKEG